MRFLRLQSAVVSGPDLEKTRESPVPLARDKPEVAAMTEEIEGSVQAAAEQSRYAAVMEKAAHFGLLLLLITFPVYVFGLLEPHTPLNQVSRYWALDAAEYCAQAQVGTGWSWVSMLGKGDFLNYLGITLLASVTAICYLAILPQLFRRKDLIYTVLAVLQLAILILAASGLLTVGH